MRSAAWIALLLAPIAGTPAAAQGVARQASFVVAQSAFDVSLPEGFCAAEGVALENAREMADTDTRNVTHLTIVTCGDDVLAEDYVIVKSSRTFLEQRLNARRSFADLRPMFDAGYRPGGNAAGSAHQAQGAGDALGMAALGSDDRCLYAGGIERHGTPAEPMLLTGGSCTTVVGDQLITVYAACYRRQADTVSRLVALATKVAHGIAPRAAAS